MKNKNPSNSSSKDKAAKSSSSGKRIKSFKPANGSTRFKKTKVTHGWVPSEETVEIAGRIVPGMIYVCDSNRKQDRYCEQYPYSFWIDVSKPAKGEDRKGQFVNSCKYDDMAPESRASYLDWLANGKQDTDYSPDYVKLYFYGLEQRYLSEELTEEEMEQIEQELLRLQSRFEHIADLNASINSLLEFNDIEANFNIEQADYLKKHYGLPLGLYAEISESLHEGEALTGQEVLSLYCNEIGTRDFSQEELKSMRMEFLMRFSRAYPKGMDVGKPNKRFAWTYQSPSGELEISLEAVVSGHIVYDVGTLKAPLTKAEELLKEISGSRVNRNTLLLDDRNSVSLEDWSKLFGFDDSFEFNSSYYANWYLYEGREMKKWMRKTANEKNPLTFHEFFDAYYGIMFDMHEMDMSEILSPENWKHLEIELASLKFGLAPHSFLVSQNWSARMNKPVALYSLKKSHLKEPGEFPCFHVALAYLGLAAYVYSKAGLDSNDMRSKCMEQAAILLKLCNGLTECDFEGIQKNLECLVRNPPQDSFITKLKSRSTPGLIEKLRSWTIEFASELDISETEVVPAIEETYRIFELDPKQAHSDILARVHAKRSNGNAAGD